MESAEGPPDLRRKPRWELAGRWADLSEEVVSALKRTEQAKGGSSAANQVCPDSRWRRWLVQLVVAAAAAVAESVGRSASASWTVAGEVGIGQVAETEAAKSAGVAAAVVAAEAAKSAVVAAVAVAGGRRLWQQSGSAVTRGQARRQGQAWAQEWGRWTEVCLEEAAGVVAAVAVDAGVAVAQSHSQTAAAVVGPSASCDAHSPPDWQDVEVEQGPAKRYAENDERGGGDAAVNDRGRPGWSDALYQYHQSNRLCGGPSLLCNPPSPWPTAIFALGTRLVAGGW